MNNVLNTTERKEIKILIRQLQSAYFSRDYSKTVEVFSPVWDVATTPDFSYYEPLTQAELYKLAGAHLVNYGKAKNLPTYQENGKDVLTKAIGLFLEIDHYESAMECQMLMAIAYSQEGSIEEYEALLDDAESYFTSDKSHSVYLLIQINYLIVEINRRDLIPALKRRQKIAPFVQVSSDLRVKTLFLIQAAIISCLWREFDSALQYFTEAATYARATENRHYEAMILNGAANTYRDMKLYPAALKEIDQALELAKNDEGWTAHFLDTQASIYLDMGDYDRADEIASTAVELFRRGEDYGGLTEAMWTQMRILFKLDLREIAFRTFFELYALTSERIGSKAADHRLNEFVEIVYVFEGDGKFYEKVELYKRFLIQNALFQTKGKIGEAAKLLGIEKHQTLSRMIRANFPEILEDFNLSRKKRSDRKYRPQFK